MTGMSTLKKVAAGAACVAAAGAVSWLLYDRQQQTIEPEPEVPSSSLKPAGVHEEATEKQTTNEDHENVAEEEEKEWGHSWMYNR